MLSIDAPQQFALVEAERNRVIRLTCAGLPRGPLPGQDECEVGLSERRPDERTRELYASVESQHARLSRAVEHSADLVSASQDQAERFVAVLEHAAAKVAPEWAKTGAAVRREEALRRQPSQRCPGTLPCGRSNSPRAGSYPSGSWSGQSSRRCS